MKTLAFDTSNTVLSVSIDEDGKQLSSYFSDEKKTHSITLLPAIDESLKKAELTMKDIDQIIVAQGPGSFTGVRIAVTTAKTLAWTLNIDLKGVSSLELIAANINKQDVIIVPYFDARRSNVFAGAYKWQDNVLISKLEDGHYTIDDLINQLKDIDDKVIFVGTDIDELQQKANNQLNNVDFSDLYKPNAHNLVELSKSIKPVENIDDFIPKYLRYTKAEYDWLKNRDNKDIDDNYVKRV
ncbi:tRNA (adenosine(37)-N6)-threonylcarbamoyltransferase complex dimerization subunit type 1 TsaB [Companilactobacillus sp. DQM5]|uniref:tRNA (adenosine(37)-N6)-threonylcarbamoyltransferase complex dimerization subunit type 1 TsaB n=1 Tax=Companilactobacillus sp. DQM5 TaxID=3463359 RepID=UPI004059CD93